MTTSSAWGKKRIINVFFSLFAFLASRYLCHYSVVIWRRYFVSVVVFMVGLLTALSAAAECGDNPAQDGAPGVKQSQDNATWTYAGKTGIGTSYERYVNGTYSDNGPTGHISKVWFSIAQGIVTETAYGMIHEAQIKDLQFLITDNGFFDEEKVATQHKTEYLSTDAQGRPLSLAYKVTSTANNNKYVIEKHIFTDPDRQTLFLHVIFTAKDNNLTPYILINPHMKNSGRYDVAYVGKDYLNAREGNDLFMSLRLRSPENNVQFVKTSTGFEGVSDGWQDLKDNGVMDWSYPWADCGGGNVVMMAQLPTLNKGETRTFDIAVGFGNSHQTAMAEADASLQEGYTALLNKYKYLSYSSPEIKLIFSIG